MSIEEVFKKANEKPKWEAVEMKQWKINQRTYQAIMANRHTDIIEEGQIIEGDRVSGVEALKYVSECSFPMHQPTKSRLVAIIYAYLLQQHFGEVVEEVLDDPDLFLGEDPYFKRYSEDREGYDYLLDLLGPFQDWRHKGWALRTNQYFWLECTDEGVAFAAVADAGAMQDFLNFAKTIDLVVNQPS